MEVQILSEPVRGWDGDSIKSLGQVAYMSQVHVQSSSSEVRRKEGWVSLAAPRSCLGVKIVQSHTLIFLCLVVAQIHCFVEACTFIGVITRYFVMCVKPQRFQVIPSVKTFFFTLYIYTCVTRGFFSPLQTQKISSGFFIKNYNSTSKKFFYSVYPIVPLISSWTFWFDIL